MTSSFPIKSPRKLIEVALPLDAINAACAREKSIRHGHPSTLHLWWARRPLAAARAVIFAQLVNDPAGLWETQNPGQRPNQQQRGAFTKRRQELFKIIEDLVKWENTTKEEFLEPARAEIRRSWREVCELNKDHPQAAELFNPDKLPALHDPFAGGGAIPLEAQRLGLEAYASDLNPVAVLINKAMIEIPPKFAGRPPVSLAQKMKDEGKSMKGKASQPELHHSSFNLHPSSWPGATGLAEDVRYYGAWMREEAQKRIGHLYPPVEITAEMAKERPDLKPLVGQKLTVIAWLWARTVKSPNPAFSHVDVPLVSTFILSNKEGKGSYVVPNTVGANYSFKVKVGAPPPEAESGTKLARANFGCVLSGAPIDTKYIRAEACDGRMGQRLLAIVADGPEGRLYLSPTETTEAIALSARPTWKPDLKVTTPCHDIDRLPMYGMFTWGDAFTSRQLVALTTISDLIAEARVRIMKDALASGRADDGQALDSGGTGATAYSEAVSVYLAFALGKATDYNSSICTWINGGQTMRNTFGRQAIPMVWDFAEANPIEFSTGSFLSAIEQGIKVLRQGIPARGLGVAIQAGAQSQSASRNKVVSTDPPYYDNIGYADLSDFFYVWLRRALT
jgi:putative DNA methylase